MESCRSTIYDDVELGELRKVRRYLRHGGDPNIFQYNRNYTLLELACGAHPTKLTPIISELHKWDGNKSTYTEVRAKFLDIVRKLRSYGNQFFRSEQRQDVVLCLLQNGADASLKSKGKNPHEKSTTPLVISVLLGRYDMIDLLFKYGVSGNEVLVLRRNSIALSGIPDNTFSGLHLASAMGDLEGTALLLQNGADVNKKSAAGVTALWCAVFHGREDIVEELLKNGANPNIWIPVTGLHPLALSTGFIGIQRCTCLHVSCAFGEVAIVHQLLSNYAEVEDEQDETGSTPLFVATYWQHYEVMGMLLQHGADPEKVMIMDELCFLTKEFAELGIKRCSSVHLACLMNDVQALSILLSFSSSVDIGADLGITPLAVAVFFKKHAAAEFILSKGANPNLLFKVNRQGELGRQLGEYATHFCTCLHISAMYGDTVSISMLLRHNATVDMDSGYGVTPLIMAALAGQSEAMQPLLQAGANAEHAITQGGLTSLMIACRSGNKAVVDILMDHGVDLETKDIHVQSALFHAVWGYPNIDSGGNFLCAQRLIEAGVKVGTRNIYGVTPLMCAIRFGHQHIVDLLLSCGKDLDLDAISSNGSSALGLARAMKYENIENKIISLGANPNIGSKPIDLKGFGFQIGSLWKTRNDQA